MQNFTSTLSNVSTW